MRINPVRIGTIAARLLCAAAFAMAGFAKLRGAPQMVHVFETVGWGQWFRLFIGAAEVAGACGLLVRAVAPLAAVGLAIIMAGAVVTHLTVLGGSPVGALVLLGLLLFVVAGERRQLRAVLALSHNRGAANA